MLRYESSSHFTDGQLHIIHIVYTYVTSELGSNTETCLNNTEHSYLWNLSKLHFTKIENLHKEKNVNIQAFYRQKRKRNKDSKLVLICYNETQYNTSLLLPLYIYTQILTSKLKKTVVKGLTGDVDWSSKINIVLILDFIYTLWISVPSSLFFF